MDLAQNFTSDTPKILVDKIKFVRFFLILAHFWLNFAVFLGAFFCTHFYSSGSSTIEFLIRFYTRNMPYIIGGNFLFLRLYHSPISCYSPEGIEGKR